MSSTMTMGTRTTERAHGGKEGRKPEGFPQSGKREFVGVGWVGFCTRIFRASERSLKMPGKEVVLDNPIWPTAFRQCVGFGGGGVAIS